MEKNKLSKECETFKSNYNHLLEKYDKLRVEQNSFKAIILKEFRNVKYDLVEMIKERDMLSNFIVDFKEYFLKLNINEKGEILLHN